MFILLTGTNTKKVLVNLNLVTTSACVQGSNTVYFIGGDYVKVAESIEQIHEMIQSAEKRYRK